MKFDRKILANTPSHDDAMDDDALLWETAKEALKQIGYILMIIAAGVGLVLWFMVSIFTMPFREGFK